MLPLIGGGEDQDVDVPERLFVPMPGFHFLAPAPESVDHPEVLGPQGRSGHGWPESGPRLLGKHRLAGTDAGGARRIRGLCDCRVGVSVRGQRTEVPMTLANGL